MVANALLAHVLLKEYLTRRNCFGVALAILGSVVISLTAPVTIIDPVEVQGSNYIFVSLVKPRALIFLVLVVVASVLLANPCGMRQLVSAEYRSTHIWANCMMCGLLGCITVMGAKGVSTAFTELINGEFGMWVGPECWLTYVLVVSAIGSIIGQVNFLNRAMMVSRSADVAARGPAHGPLLPPGCPRHNLCCLWTRAVKSNACFVSRIGVLLTAGGVGSRGCGEVGVEGMRMDGRHAASSFGTK